MIFKFCVWPTEEKEGKDQEDTKVLAEDCGTSGPPPIERTFAGAAMCCCPCVFRSRKSVDVESQGTPVIAIRLNHNSDATHVSIQDKAVADDEEYGLQNRVSSRSSVYEIQRNSSSRNPQYYAGRVVQNTIAFDGDGDRPAGAESSNSNISETDNHRSEIRRINDDFQHSQDEIQSSISPASHNSRSSTPRSQQTAAFDVVPFHKVPSSRNSVNSYVISLSSKKSNLPDETIAVEITDEDSSSTDVDRDEQTDDQSIQDKLSHDFENLNAGDETDDTFESKITRTRDSVPAPLTMSSDESEYSHNISKETFRSIISLNKSTNSPSSLQYFQQLHDEESITLSKQSPISGESRDTVISNHSIDRIFPRFSRDETTNQNGSNSSRKSSNLFADIANNNADETEEAILPTVLPDDTGSMQSLGSRSFQELDRPELYSNSNSASMGRSSRSQSMEHIGTMIDDNSRGNNVQPDDPPASTELTNSKSSSRTLSAKDTTSPTEAAEISALGKLGIDGDSQILGDIGSSNIAANRNEQSEPTEPSKNQPSKVPRVKPKSRVNSVRGNPPPVQSVSKATEKPKATVQLCLSQLESKDWEVIAKGLKTLSQIARQNPTQLELCGSGKLGRVLGRHVRNLRSQVSRAACLAAGEVFVSQSKGIEQEIDDIAGPLLHRTADTNKFLRADSNAALDRMIESIPAHKTIAVIIHRGAMHQNPIVRATTARLLSDIVNRIGPDQAMTLPRDVRDKLLVTGAKLLIDGNLDARNNAKNIFRGLSHCDGFRKALKDAVPETTLRHIDKTLRTL